MGKLAGYVTERNAYQVCSMAGISAVKGKITNLTELRRSIGQSLVELDKAKSDVAFWSAALLTAQLAKASCDAFMEIAGNLTGPAGQGIAAAYGAANPLVDAAARSGAGQKNVSWAKAMNASASVVTKHAVPMSKGGEMLFDLQTFKTDIVIDAVNGDADGIKGDLQGYSLELTAITAKELMHKLPEEKADRIVGTGKALIELGLKVAEAVSEYRQGSDSSALEGTRRTLKVQAKRIDAQIADLQRILDSCQAALSIRRA